MKRKNDDFIWRNAHKAARLYPESFIGQNHHDHKVILRAILRTQGSDQVMPDRLGGRHRDEDDVSTIDAFEKKVVNGILGKCVFCRQRSGKAIGTSSRPILQS